MCKGISPGGFVHGVKASRLLRRPADKMAFTLIELLACRLACLAIVPFSRTVRRRKPPDRRLVFQSVSEQESIRENSGYGGVWRRQAKARFTLIELLVIIAIIIALVTLLLPALETAIIISHGPVCKNHMKNIGSGLAMYTSDWNGRFFGANGNPNIVQSDYDNPAAGSDGRGYCWARRLYNAGYYAKTGKTHSGPTTWDNNDAWKCPEFKRFSGNTWSSHATYYGTQVMLKWPGNPPGGYDENVPVIWPTDITYPARRCVVLEIEADVHYAWGGPYFEWQLVKMGFPGFPGSTQLGNIAFDIWHEGHTVYHLGAPNFLYADFHVDTLNRMQFWSVCDMTAPGRCGRPILLPSHD